MGQPRAKTGANLRPNRANIGQQQQHQQPPPPTTTTPTPARADGSAFAGARLSGVSLINPARGPLAVSLPYGSSLLSVGERGRAPCRRPTRPPKSPAFYGVLCSPRFWPFFGSCGLRWVNMGQDRPQDGPT